MNLQEFETIRYNKVPVKIIVVNNNAYAVSRKGQVELLRSRTIGTEPSDGVSIPDFKKVAEAFEIPYVKINNSTELVDILKQLFVTEGPVLCEVMGIENQDYLSSSHTRNAEKRIVNRPIEDQAPFREREIFLSEMIVKPIDQ